MVESKTLLYSLLAGLLTGIIFSIVYTIHINPNIDDFIYETIYYQNKANGLSEDKARRLASETTKVLSTLNWLFILSPIMNSLILSIIFGLLLDLLINKTKLKPSIASIITGLSLLLLQLTILSITIIAAGTWLLDLINKYIGLTIIIAYPLTYTIILFILNTFKGPWIRWGESKPKIY